MFLLLRFIQDYYDHLPIFSFTHQDTTHNYLVHLFGHFNYTLKLLLL